MVIGAVGFGGRANVMADELPACAGFTVFGSLPRRAAMALTYDAVSSVGFERSPKSPVCAPSSSAASRAFSIVAACCVSPMCRSIISPERMSAVGFAMPLPAMSGAVPCTASKMLMLRPMLALGAKPRPPTSPAARSLTMSPCRLVSTTILYCCGFITRFMHRASMITSPVWMPG